MAKVALYSLDVIGESMAGPGIRYWEFANALSKKHEVTLLIPNKTTVTSCHFKIVSYGHSKIDYNQFDVLITQKISSLKIVAAKRKGLRIILDAYDPMPLENLEVFKAESMDMRNIRNEQITNSFLYSFQLADTVICANSRQKDLWMGLLLSQKKIVPSLYDMDENLANIIDIVPFGLSETPPQRSPGMGLRERFGIKKEDKVLLWGGGIWNWFDPLTLIEAMYTLSKTRDDIKLVFMGIKHPNEGIPEMEMSKKAIELAKKYKLIDKHVFFNFGWIPYQERVNFLLEADIGVSTHFQHLETRYAFRTRILDYIWAGLPIICSEGDSFSDLVTKKKLGLSVPVNDSQAIAEAIISIVDNPKVLTECKQNLVTLKPDFYWDTVAQPINRMIEQFSKVPHKTGLAYFKNCYQAIVQVLSPILFIKRGLRAWSR